MTTSAYSKVTKQENTAVTQNRKIKELFEKFKTDDMLTTGVIKSKKQINLHWNQ